MSKEAYFFSHDYGSRNDPKLVKVKMKLKHEGKSIFWDLVEMLYEEGGYLLLSEIDAYAFALHTHYDIINDLINNYNLFEKDDVKFWSNSVLNRLNKRNEIVEKRRLSAEKRWSNANALQMQSECNAKKGKERKGKDINKEINKERIFTPPTIEEFKIYFKENGFDAALSERAWKGYDVAEWHDSQGKKILSWKQKCQNNWFKTGNNANGKTNNRPTTQTGKKFGTL